MLQAPVTGPAPSLQDTSTRIDTRVTELDKKIAKCDEDLRRYAGASKSGQQKQLALQCLKRKKMYEQQRDQILGTQFNVDSLAGAQEQAEINVMTVEAMKGGYQELKERYTQIGGVMDIAWSLLHGQNRTWAVVSPHCQGRVMSGYVGPRRPSYEVEFFNMCKDA
ncbi:unnamed protein product [Cladocopium goreaui]|uniref:Charged multivesicular body protein 5 (Chromatin-modifying protein 5) n=1 Tax=Cladocopium goreaui TaxID=2562237 RepID=A0A9P1DRN0_9DINO|nr:unnamed protein product [Cladocopium goreaui]